MNEWQDYLNQAQETTLVALHVLLNLPLEVFSGPNCERLYIQRTYITINNRELFECCLLFA